MKAFVVALSLITSLAAQAQLSNTCYVGSVDSKPVKLHIKRGTNGITQTFSVGEHRIQGSCFRVSQALAMYCTSNVGTMAFGLEYQGNVATLQVLGSLALSHPTRVQDHLIIEEGSEQGLISLNETSCK